MANLLIGALIGALFSYLAQNFAAIRSMQVAKLNSHIATLDTLEGFATEYWLLGPSASRMVEQALEARINAHLTALNHFESDAQKLLGALYARYSAVAGDLYDHVTGGDYETARRDFDKFRAQQIASCCTEMRSILSDSRIGLFWFH